MNELILYFMKSSGILLLFLSLYFTVLRKETFFTENRFFLLGGMFISLILPFLVITQYIEIPTNITHETPTFMVAEDASVLEKDAGIPWLQILFYTYAIGVIFFFCKFLVELFSLCKLLWNSKVARRNEQFVYIETTSSFSPFSFFNYIVYNPALYSESELAAILKHEQAHSRQLHSIDVFVSKLYCIFMWFNPFAWCYKRFVLQNLEFLADSAAIKQTPSKKEYQLTLLKVSGNTYCPALTNNFYNSLIKKRIVMLQKTKSTQLHKWKHACILPMLTAFVCMFNTEVIAKEKASKTTPIIENTSVDKAYGDVVVTITKNTTVKELKAIQKMFKSFDIMMSYNIKKFNSKNEITAIKLDLKDKDNAEASATFESSENKPIPTINIGKKDGRLLVTSSGKHILHSNAFSYEIHEDHDENHDGEKNKKIIIKTADGKATKLNRWVKEEEVKTIDIRKKDGKEVIIVNGKVLAPDEIIEEEIEIKKGDGKGNTYVYTYSSEGDQEKKEDVEVKITKKFDNKIVLNSSNSKEKPLIIINGKEASHEKFTQLDADKIKSVSVLKGETATKQYGEKGKNGVVIVETKKK